MSCICKFVVFTFNSSEFDTIRETHLSLNMRQRAVSNNAFLVAAPRLVVADMNRVFFFVNGGRLF